MTITMETLTGMGEGEKVVTTGTAGQRVWTADGNGNLIDVAGAPVPLDYFRSYVAASTIVPYRDGMEDNPMPQPGTLVKRGNAFYFVFGEAPDRPGVVQLGYLDGNYMSRLYEYNWEAESPNIMVIKRVEQEDFGEYQGYLSQRGQVLHTAMIGALARSAMKGDAKARLREFADRFADDDFWQFLQAYDLVPTVTRTVTLNLSGRATLADGVFGDQFVAGGTAAWKRQIAVTVTVLPEAGCVCDQVNHAEAIAANQPGSTTSAKVESSHCGEGCQRGEKS